MASIHPRVLSGKTTFTKVNTSKPHKGKGKLAKKMDNLHKRRLDHASTLQRLPPSRNPACYRTPGSMK